MIDPATFKQRITIEQAVPVTDSQGGQALTWQPIGPEIWASVLPTTGREAYTWGKVMAEAQYVIKLRYRPGITTAMRAIYAGRTLEIGSVIDPDEGRKYLVLGCTEKR